MNSSYIPHGKKPRGSLWDVKWDKLHHETYWPG